MPFTFLLKDYFCFLKYPCVLPFVPHTNVRDDWRMRMSWVDLFKCLIMVYVFVFILLSPIVLFAVKMMGVVNILEMKLSENMGDWRILLATVFWAPFVEEMVFRYWLKGLGQYGWLAVFVAIVGMLLGFSVPWVVLIIFVMFLFWLPYECKQGVVLGQVRGCVQCREQFVNWGFYISSLMFGFVHLFNYNFGQAEFLYLAPLLILPQLFVGTFLAWIRLRYSILTGIIFHAIYNSVPVIVMILFKFFDLV